MWEFDVAVVCRDPHVGAACAPHTTSGCNGGVLDDHMDVEVQLPTPSAIWRICFARGPFNAQDASNEEKPCDWEVEIRRP